MTEKMVSNSREGSDISISIATHLIKRGLTSNVFEIIFPDRNLFSG